MKNKFFAGITFLLFLTATFVSEAKKIELLSPDGGLKVSIELTDKISYSIFNGSDPLLTNCRLQLNLKSETLGVNPKLIRSKAGKIDETIKPAIAYKNSVINNKCNTLRMDFKGNYSVEFRAFNDGVAYRFLTDKKGDIEVLNEDFVVNFPAEYSGQFSLVKGFKTSCEEPYATLATTAFVKEERMSYLPVLIDAGKGVKILLSEADLHDYPGMFVKGTGENGMSSVFPKTPLEFGDDGDRSVKILKEADYIAKTIGKRSFPWRTFMITKNDAQLIGNDLIFKLSTPNVLEKTDWIKPGQVSWEWWHDARLYGVDFRSGYNMDSYKYYIDFASKYKIPYIIMDEGWAASTRDPFTPNSTINLKELIQYGKERNVKIVLWLTWLTVDKHMELFKTFHEWGIAGCKIDFMDRQDQWMVNYYERVVKEAAKYDMMVDFHGAFKPSGLERMYPNLMAHEGVRGLEQGGGCKPENSVWLPFIRNAVGPMDFTPGSMNSAQPEDNRYTRANAMGSGTRAFQMALFVIFETGLQMLADNPVYYYREHECTEFMTKVPVTWDETKAIYAKAGDAVMVAKRKGDKWFLGAITGDKSQNFEVTLDFLPAGKDFKMTYFVDGINADRQAMDYKKKEMTVNSKTKLPVTMVRNGGFAGVIE